LKPNYRKLTVVLRRPRAVAFAALALLLAGLWLGTGSTLAQTGGGYDLSWFVLAGGGGTSAGSPYSISGTAGQPGVDTLSGDRYTLIGGFWSAGPAQTSLYLPLVQR
jgi:hypothetical protein